MHAGAHQRKRRGGAHDGQPGRLARARVQSLPADRCACRVAMRPTPAKQTRVGPEDERDLTSSGSWG